MLIKQAKYQDNLVDFSFFGFSFIISINKKERKFILQFYFCQTMNCLYYKCFCNILLELIFRVQLELVNSGLVESGRFQSLHLITFVYSNFTIKSLS